MLGVVQGLHHRQQGRPCISLLIHARQIVVQLNDTLVKPSGRQEPHRHEYINNICKENSTQKGRDITFMSISATSFITPLNHSNDPGSLLTQENCAQLVRYARLLLLLLAVDALKLLVLSSDRLVSIARS